MSITSSRNVQIQFSGDVSTEVVQSALDNDNSTGVMNFITLINGNNNIFPPGVSGSVITGLTIIPPVGNVNIITLKGDTSDVGIPLHLTDPTSIALDTTFVNLVLSVDTQTLGVRLIWT